MHPALSLPEILGHILQNLDQRDLASCTTVSHQFWEESLSLLWRDVTLADCAQLLPGVSCNISTKTRMPTKKRMPTTRTIGFGNQPKINRPIPHLRVDDKRELQPADWTRFQVHAPFVKRLRLQASVNHAGIFPVLKDYHSAGPLFRNLRSLQVEEVQPSHKKFIGLFTSPTVDDVDIRQSRPNPALAESVISLIPLRFPSLSSLTIHLPSYTMRPSETVLDTVKHYSSLTRLEIRATPQELAQVVQFASQMDHLSQAAFMGVENTDINIPDDAFKSLQTLHVEGCGVEGIRRIVSGVTSADLRQLEVTLSPWSTSTAEADILPSLDRFPKLKVLRLSELQWPLLHSSLASVLKHSSLEEVSIRGGSLDFSQDVLRTMAQSWPELRRLQLVPADYYGTEIPPLGMLRCFAEFCPKLESLSAGVRLNLADEEMRHWQEAHGAGLALRLIDVGYSSIVLSKSEWVSASEMAVQYLRDSDTSEVIEQHLRDVATSLLASWPNLTTLKYYRKGVDAEGWARLQRVLNKVREGPSA